MDNKIKKENGVKHLFVYGTLMKGLRLHYLMLKKGFKFISKAKLKSYDLYQHNEIPLIISGKGEVYGEVYEILKPICLKYLDRVEHNYNRIIAEVKIKNKTIETFVYSSKYPQCVEINKNFQKIKSGDYRIR